MKHITLMAIVIVIAFPVTVFAESVVTHSGTTYLGCGSISDSTVWLIDQNDVTTPKTGFIYAPDGCQNVLPGVPKRYRKVVGGLVVEMSQAEKDIVDAPALAAQQRRDEVDVEVTNNQVCNAVWEQVRDRLIAEHDLIDSNIDGLKNIVKVRTFLRQSNNRVWQSIGRLGRCVMAMKEQGGGG